MNKNRRCPKNAVDTERIKITRCKYCRQKITFGCSVGRDGKRLACNIDGTLRVDKEWGERMLVPKCACVSSFNRKLHFPFSYPYSTKKLYLGNPESPHYRKDIHTYIGTKVPVSTSSRNGTGGKCHV